MTSHQNPNIDRFSGFADCYDQYRPQPPVTPPPINPSQKSWQSNKSDASEFRQIHSAYQYLCRRSSRGLYHSVAPVSLITD